MASRNASSSSSGITCVVIVHLLQRQAHRQRLCHGSAMSHQHDGMTGEQMAVHRSSPWSKGRPVITGVALPHLAAVGIQGAMAGLAGPIDPLIEVEAALDGRFRALQADGPGPALGLVGMVAVDAEEAPELSAE
jgi:hypothetical protein